MELSMVIAIIGCVIGVLSFFHGRKDKSLKDVSESQYKMGQIDEKLATISAQIKELSNKLDSFDHEVDTKIEKAIEHHERVHHKGE